MYCNSIKFLKNNSSTILTIFGCVGVVATTISAVKASNKLPNDILQKGSKKNRSLSKSEKTFEVVKAYIPTVTLGVATIACFVEGHLLSKQQQQGLTGAYMLVNRSFNDYRDALIELYGEECDKEIMDNIILSRYNPEWHQVCLNAPDKKVTFYEPLTGQFFNAYEREIMDAEYHFNRNFVIRGYACLNELLQFLGIEEYKFGEHIGWSMDYGYSWIDFSHREIVDPDTGNVCYAIHTLFAPDMEYDDEY